jgi:hypothetical protein
LEHIIDNTRPGRKDYNMPAVVCMRDMLEACSDEEDARIREDIQGIFLEVDVELRQLPSSHTEEILEECEREWAYLMGS